MKIYQKRHSFHACQLARCFQLPHHMVQSLRHHLVNTLTTTKCHRHKSIWSDLYSCRCLYKISQTRTRNTISTCSLPCGHSLSLCLRNTLRVANWTVKLHSSSPSGLKMCPLDLLLTYRLPYCIYGYSSWWFNVIFTVSIDKYTIRWSRPESDQWVTRREGTW